MTLIPKHSPHRDRKLLDLARGESCVACGADDGTIVWAHSNLPEHGKGMSMKASDAMGAFLCACCHYQYDQGKGMTRPERRQFILAAICKTHLRLWQEGKVGLLVSD